MRQKYNISSESSEEDESFENVKPTSRENLVKTKKTASPDQSSDEDNGHPKNFAVQAEIENPPSALQTPVFAPNRKVVKINQKRVAYHQTPPSSEDESEKSNFSRKKSDS